MAEVAEGRQICRQVGNISAIFAKRASNVDEGQEKERYMTNIESARKENHTGCALQIHSFRNTPLAIHGRLKASHGKCKLKVTCHKRILNPRQPAWKAGGYTIAARLVYIGLTAGFMRFFCNVSGPGKRCRARFFRFSAKHVTYFCPCFRQKTLRTS